MGGSDPALKGFTTRKAQRFGAADGLSGPNSYKRLSALPFHANTDTEKFPFIPTGFRTVNMRVLLISSNRRSDALAAPPIGVCYIAGAAEAAGHDVRVVDLCFKRNIKEALRNSISDFAPQVIGVSVRNIDNVNLLFPVSYLPETAEVVNYIKTLTDAPIVLGGAGASLSPAAVLDYLKADFIVVSEGEDAFTRLLSALENGRSTQGIPGVGSMNGNRFDIDPPRHGGFSGFSPEVGKWVDVGPYERIGSHYNIQTKRGCPHRCIYCTYGRLIEGASVRLRSAVEVVDEIEEALHSALKDFKANNTW
jgi:radical SAM superfamily enzyme YgiQ (UPF0313 family)